MFAHDFRWNPIYSSHRYIACIPPILSETCGKKVAVYNPENRVFNSRSSYLSLLCWKKNTRAFIPWKKDHELTSVTAIMSQRSLTSQRRIPFDTPKSSIMTRGERITQHKSRFRSKPPALQRADIAINTNNVHMNINLTRVSISNDFRQLSIIIFTWTVYKLFKTSSATDLSTHGYLGEMRLMVPWVSCIISRSRFLHCSRNHNNNAVELPACFAPSGRKGRMDRIGDTVKRMACFITRSRASDVKDAASFHQAMRRVEVQSILKNFRHPSTFVPDWYAVEASGISNSLCLSLKGDNVITCRNGAFFDFWSVALLHHKPELCWKEVVILMTVIVNYCKKVFHWRCSKKWTGLSYLLNASFLPVVCEFKFYIEAVL